MPRQNCSDHVPMVVARPPPVGTPALNNIPQHALELVRARSAADEKWMLANTHQLIERTLRGE